MWISRFTPEKSSTYRPQNGLHKHCIYAGRVWDKKVPVYKVRVFPHLILWICRQLSTDSLKKCRFYCQAGGTGACRISSARIFLKPVRRLEWKLARRKNCCQLVPDFCRRLWKVCRTAAFAGSPRLLRFYGLQDVYIKIVVVVNAHFSVDKSLFLLKIICLREK